MCAGLADITQLKEEEIYLVQQLKNVRAQLAQGGQLTPEERMELKEDKKQLTDTLMSLRPRIIACLRAQGAWYPVCKGPDGRRSALTLWLSTVAAVLHTPGCCWNSSSGLLACMEIRLLHVGITTEVCSQHMRQNAPAHTHAVVG
jgi:hypothetical protein